MMVSITVKKNSAKYLALFDSLLPVDKPSDIGEIAHL
ncbi:hypothetical protein EPYR_02284 [Erwinia pyrifoliae DSM 12163]|nr:hypothetical protein EPYR_02284 [Erwinia pyrifoliae DSM 12163]